MPKILIVEDDPAVRGVVEIALNREGMTTLTAGDGEEALRRLDSSDANVDLVILDVMLPGMDGVSVCREIRAGGESSDVPIIMLTARDDETSVVVGLEVGADDYITKPFSPRQLVSRVRALLRRRRLDANVAASEPRKIEFPGLE
ncbi:MAG TPA: response regulator, partial [Rubrobacter sp.]|nr:response regulator [Rubrobacter sp.]